MCPDPRVKLVFYVLSAVPKKSECLTPVANVKSVPVILDLHYRHHLSLCIFGTRGDPGHGSLGACSVFASTIFPLKTWARHPSKSPLFSPVFNSVEQNISDFNRPPYDVVGIPSCVGITCEYSLQDQQISGFFRGQVVLVILLWIVFRLFHLQCLKQHFLAAWAGCFVYAPSSSGPQL